MLPPEIAAAWKARDVDALMAIAADTPMVNASLGDWALKYAGAGLPVTPGYPGGKKPAHWNGLYSATCNMDAVERWWTSHPGCNPLVKTGCGLDVIDLDGELGYASAVTMTLESLPPILGVSVSRKDGMHLWIASNGRGNRTGMLPGVDYRGKGGYVVVPPSMVTPKLVQGDDGAYVSAVGDMSGQTGYRWHTPISDETWKQLSCWTERHEPFANGVYTYLRDPEDPRNPINRKAPRQ